MDTEKASTTEEIYKYNEYIILDASWGQYTEGVRLEHPPPCLTEIRQPLTHIIRKEIRTRQRRFFGEERRTVDSRG